VQEGPRRKGSERPRAGGRGRQARKTSAARRVFGPMVEAGAEVYLRPRDLPKLIALWPYELEDASLEGCRRLIAKLRRALKTERRRALSGHWSYDLNRHVGLLSAYKGELAYLSRLERQPNRTRRGGDNGRG